MLLFWATNSISLKGFTGGNFGDPPLEPPTILPLRSKASPLAWVLNLRNASSLLGSQCPQCNSFEDRPLLGRSWVSSLLPGLPQFLGKTCFCPTASGRRVYSQPNHLSPVLWIPFSLSSLNSSIICQTPYLQSPNFRVTCQALWVVFLKSPVSFGLRKEENMAPLPVCQLSPSY